MAQCPLSRDGFCSPISRVHFMVIRPVWFEAKPWCSKVSGVLQQLISSLSWGYKSPSIFMVSSQPWPYAMPVVDSSGQGLCLGPFKVVPPFMENHQLEKICGGFVYGFWCHVSVWSKIGCIWQLLSVTLGFACIFNENDIFFSIAHSFCCFNLATGEGSELEPESWNKFLKAIYILFLKKKFFTLALQPHSCRFVIS